MSYQALSVPGLAQLLLSALFARTATRMVAVVLVLFVLDVHHSPSLSGVVVLVSLLPGMLFSPIAGALLDRRGRLALIGLDYFIGGCTFSLVAALSLTHHLSEFALLVIVGIGALTQPLSNAGTRSLIPAMVPRHLWDRANAIDSNGYVIANICGPAIAVAVALLGPRAAVLFPTVCLAIAALLLVGLHVPDMQSAEQHGLLTDALDGLRYVWNHPVLRNVGITLSLYFGSSGVLPIVVPLIVERRLHLGSVAVGSSFAVMGAAGFVSGLIAGKFGTAGKEARIFASPGSRTRSRSRSSRSCRARSWSSSSSPSSARRMGRPPVTVFSLRQRTTDRECFGRAFAVSMTLNGMGNPLGAALCGFLASRSLVLATLTGAFVAFIAGMLPVLRPSYHRDESGMETALLQASAAQAAEHPPG